MTCIVQKYGGSSVADVPKLQQIAARIADIKNRQIDIAVVVSAMGKSTDNLVALARDISANPPRREMDMLLSTGERTAMSLLSIALHALGVEAVSLTGSQAGIITNHRHNDAQVIEVRPFRVQDELAAGRVVIVGGFQGVSYKRDITTLGRGGSDTSAVALAAALNADRCEIYSDVDGVYSADPSLVTDAWHLKEISYPAMQEMSTAGARVLNAGAVQFAKEKNIAIYARSTFAPGQQTIVRRLSPGSIMGVQAVVHEQSIERLALYGEGVPSRFAAVIDFLENEQVPVKEVNVATADGTTANARASFVVSSDHVYGWEAIRNRLKNEIDPDISCQENLAAVSLIGEGLNRDNQTLLETMKLLEGGGIAVRGIATTAFRISLIVSKEQVQACTRLCHDHWITQK